MLKQLKKIVYLLKLSINNGGCEYINDTTEHDFGRYISHVTMVSNSTTIESVTFDDGTIGAANYLNKSFNEKVDIVFDKPVRKIKLSGGTALVYFI